MAFTKQEVADIFNETQSLIAKKVLTGLNYYKKSVEPEFDRVISIPTKYGHREQYFIQEMKRRINDRFPSIVTKTYPRELVYAWSKTFRFPRKDSEVRIFDTINRRVVEDEEQYKMASNELLALGKELSLVIRADKTQDVSSVVEEVFRLGSYYRLDEIGNPIEVGGQFLENSEGRISDDAYKVPMVIVPSTPKLKKKLKGFLPVRKVMRINGRQEISFYIAKLYERFKQLASSSLLGRTKVRLANKLFVDYLDYKLDERLYD